MDSRREVEDWLFMVMKLPPNRFTESFYFDHFSKLFFSIHFCDYILVDDELLSDPAVTFSGYTEKSNAAIVDWINRIEKNDERIIRVPQHGRFRLRSKRFLMDAFISKNEININEARVWSPDNPKPSSPKSRLDQMGGSDENDHH